MIRHLKSNRGFTLLEIVVVLVIVGVLIRISVPILFAQIQRQRGQEALNTMSMMRSAMESCGIPSNYNFSAGGCADWNNLTMGDPTNSRFTYTWSDESGANPPGDGTYYMTAKSSSTDWIRMRRTTAGMTCIANGIYQGMC